jgi:hypothetical protein
VAFSPWQSLWNLHATLPPLTKTFIILLLHFSLDLSCPHYVMGTITHRSAQRGRQVTVVQGNILLCMLSHGFHSSGSVHVPSCPLLYRERKTELVAVLSYIKQSGSIPNPASNKDSRGSWYRLSLFFTRKPRGKIPPPLNSGPPLYTLNISAASL